MSAIDRVNGALRRAPAWLVYVAGAAWAGWLFWLALTGQGVYAVEPINVLERAYGLIALQLLIATLLISPLRRWAGLNLLKFRRALGVTCFFFVLAHFLVFAVLDVQTLPRVWTEIVKRPYVTVGMAALVMLLPLALTSNNLSIRKLGGAGWRKLHRLTYPAAILAALHFIWLSKGFQIEPLAYAAAIGMLLLTRLRASRAS